MNYIPFGYRIEEGEIRVDEAAAHQLRELFRLYVAGTSLTKASVEAGVNRGHASITNLLKNRIYLGNGYYPQIRGEQLCLGAAERMGRGRRSHSRAVPELAALSASQHFVFTAPVQKHRYEDPFQQAAYAYSLIQEEAVENHE